MSIQIFYFSGTGNSLHVARELARRLPDARLTPMKGALNNRNLTSRAQAVGFVFPLYFTTVPGIVRSFIEQLDLSAADYVFAAVTRMGTFSVAAHTLDRLLRKKGTHLRARFMIDMANNTPTGLKPGKGMPGWVESVRPEAVSRLEENVQAQLDVMGSVVRERKPCPSSRVFNPGMALLERVMSLLTRAINTEIPYIVDATCTGCGTCERVCPSGKIRLSDNRPEWRTDVACHYCYACFNFCPTQSILVKNKYERKDGRYRHPAVEAADIAAQKAKA